MPTYCITGANGFIASHLIVELISKSHNVRGTVRKMDEDKIGFMKKVGAKPVLVADLTDEDALADAFKGCDGVFHLATYHPRYGFEATQYSRDELVAHAVDGTLAVMRSCIKAGVKRVVLTSSLAAVECGHDEGCLDESTWSRAEVYDDEAMLSKTQWVTHYTYSKMKTEQEKAASRFAGENDIDLRVILPGNLCIGHIAKTISPGINGTMKRFQDIMQGTNTLKGGADYAICHVSDVVTALQRAMVLDSASGRYLVSPNMMKLEDIFAMVKDLYPGFPVARMENLDITSGKWGKSRDINSSRTQQELGFGFRSPAHAVKDAVDSMLAHELIPARGVKRPLPPN